MERAHQAVENQKRHWPAYLITVLRLLNRASRRNSRSSNGRGRDGSNPINARAHPLFSHLANIATLLGLLGTIIGLIDAFTAVSTADPAQKAELLSASIAVAMNTTVFGLVAAIPLLLLHSF